MAATVLQFPERTTTQARPAIRWRVVLCVALIVLPMVGFEGLLRVPSADITVGSGTSHFYVVSAVAALAFVLALAVIWAAQKLPDGRTFFLAMGFVAMATIFLAHGLGTSPFYGQHTHVDPFLAYGGGTTTGHANHPGYGSAAVAAPTAAPQAPVNQALADRIARGKVVGYSARLSLFISAIFFALAVVDFPVRFSEFASRHMWTLLLATAVPLGGHVLLALSAPHLLTWIPMGSAWLSWGLAAATWTALGFAGWRFLQAYRLALLPLQGAMAFGMAMLAEAQWMMIRGTLWHLSWWGYHVLMLAGFAVCVGALLRQQRCSGDLSAIVEGLFLRQQVRGIRKGDPQALVTLGAAITTKDTETAEHIGRVGDLSVALANRLWLPEDRLELVRLAGRLHDVGKIGVPKRILRKAGPLTKEEFEIMKLHSPRGWEIARQSGLLVAVAPIIRAHHEKLDGSGYPDGLVGDAISTEARIVSVADVWDALTCDRPYRRAMTANDAAEVLIKESESHLDPLVVQALFDELSIGTRALRAA